MENSRFDKNAKHTACIRWNNARGWVTACLVERVVVPQVYHLSGLELGAVGKNWKNVVKRQKINK